MTPSSLLNVCKTAAKQPSYPEAILMLEDKLDPQYWDMAKSTVPFYICGHVLDLPTAADRRDYMLSIPEPTYPKHTKALIEMGVRKLYADLSR